MGSRDFVIKSRDFVMEGRDFVTFRHQECDKVNAFSVAETIKLLNY